ncbi:MAG: DUF4007 family protein [Dethiosulfatibacter sp.]|nr:DUF4007 family protein [Dethiosulfatibacter sp.]
MNYKIQVLNGFKMYFDQITSVFKNRYDSEEKIDLDKLSDITGLNRRKARLILNYLADIGLSEKRTLNKTKLGQIIYKHDEFLQKEGTLWLMHYLQATNEYLIVWNRSINMFYNQHYITREEILEQFDDLKDRCSEYTFNHHIGKEIRIVLDAYTNQNFKKLSLLDEERTRYSINRNQDIPLMIILATVIWYKEKYYPGATAIDIQELCKNQNSPGRIFVLDELKFRNMLEKLKNQGLISIESRADLDQIRIKAEQTFETTVEAYYNL